MKIEKVNDHQIRCTLTKEDLADREIKLSELAYGTEKAKDLFRDMMQQAAFQYGFEAEDIPLMIEAIPLNSECIVLIITKVEDPEELDTRFSKFAPSVHEDDDMEDSSPVSALTEAADGVLDLFKRIQEAQANSNKNTVKKDNDKINATVTMKPAGADLSRLYHFKDLATISKLARVLNGTYEGMNTLYKNKVTGQFSLIISKGKHSPEEYNKICNIFSEYGTPAIYSRAVEAHMQEHYERLIEYRALQSLARI